MDTPSTASGVNLYQSPEDAKIEDNVVSSPTQESDIDPEAEAMLVKKLDRILLPMFTAIREYFAAALEAGDTSVFLTPIICRLL